MKSEEIVRNWKDEEYRMSLSHSGEYFLPDNPAGLIELSEEELGGADGGTHTILIGITTTLITVWCFPPVTIPLVCYGSTS